MIKNFQNLYIVLHKSSFLSTKSNRQLYKAVFQNLSPELNNFNKAITEVFISEELYTQLIPFHKYILETGLNNIIVSITDADNSN